MSRIEVVVKREVGPITVLATTDTGQPGFLLSVRWPDGPVQWQRLDQRRPGDKAAAEREVHGTLALAVQDLGYWDAEERVFTKDPWGLRFDEGGVGQG